MAEPFTYQRSRLLILAGVVVAFVVLLYFVLTSGLFVRTVVLPRVSSAVGAVVTAEDISLSPLSSLEIRKLKVTPNGAETLLTADLVRVRYGLFAILGGDIDVGEMTLENPVITLVGKPDGSFNLPKPPAPGGRSGGKKASKAPRLDLRNVAVRNGTIRASVTSTNGVQVSEVSGLNVALDRLAGGAQGKLTVAALLATRLPNQSALSAKIDGAYDVGLDPALQPVLVKGALTVTVASATGALGELAGLQAVLEADTTATELRRLRLGFTQGGAVFAEVRLSGPFDLVKKEARITYAVSGIDRRVARLAAPALPFELGKTVVSADGRVDLVQLGQVVASQGRVKVSDLTLVSTNGTTPSLQIALDYKTGVNLSEHTAVIEKVDLNVVQGASPLVAGTLDRPMNLSWDQVSKGFRDSTFTLKLSGLKTAEWTAIAGPGLPEATVSGNVVVRSDHDGRDLKATVSATVDDLVAKIAGRTVRGARAGLLMEVLVLDFNDIGISRLSLDVQKGPTRLFTLGGTLNHSLSRQETGAQFSADVDVPAVLAEVPVEGVAATAGGIRLAGALSIKEGSTNVTANVSLANFTGSVRDMVFRDYQAALSMNADLIGGTVSIQKLGITAQTGYSPGGSLDITGHYDLARGGGQFSFKTVNLNESALAPLVASALKPNRLVSVTLDVSGTGKFSPAFDTDFSTELKVSRLVAEDPAGRLPKTPLGLGLALDLSRKGSVLDLRTLQLDLGKTTNAANLVTVAGRIDTAASNAVPSVVTVRSDGLDLTALYDLFAGGPSPGKPGAAAPTAPTTAGPGGEPAPVRLPFRQFTANLDISRIFLREVEVSDWKASLGIHDDTVTLDPFTLRLNGAPVTAKATANLGVPGFVYDVGFGADRVKLEPLVNSFQPARKGQVHGTLVANAAVKGAGVTGASLAKNLGGSFGFAATNLNLTLENTKNPVLRLIIGIVGDIPRLIKNPAGALLGHLTGSPGSDPWVQDLQAKPIDFLTVAGDLGNGGLALTTARVQSAAFRAEASGGLKFAPILTNSPLDIPVSIALERKLAEKAVLLDPSTPADAAYAPLPQFVTVKGTVGVPKPDINYAAIAVLGAKTGMRAAGGLGSNLGGKVAGAAGLLGNLLGGGGAAAEPARTSAATNAVPSKATNAPANPVGDLLRGLGRPRN